MVEVEVAGGVITGRTTGHQVRSAVMRRDGTDLACSIKVALPWNHGLASHVLSAAKRRPVERLVPAPIGACAALTLTRATGSPRHLGAKIDRSESRCGQGSDLLCSYQGEREHPIRIRHARRFARPVRSRQLTT